jgi:hypothetical protein
MHKFFSLLIFTCVITSCTLPRPQAQPTETSASPTSAANQPTLSNTFTPTPTPLSTTNSKFTQPGAYYETAAPAEGLRGTWYRYTTADGFCTDNPVFIGHSYIGMNTTSMCSIYYGTFGITAVPQGSRVNAIKAFPPGGGLIAATDVGICVQGFEEWSCRNYGDTLLSVDPIPNEEILFISGINVEPVYMSKNKVFFRNQEFKIAEITGTEDATITTGAVSSEIFAEGFLLPEIWVGTNADGIVVIQPDTGEVRRYTVDTGLPGNVIRSISTEHCPKYCDFRDIWVATDQGLAHWNDLNWTLFTTSDGLPSNDIRGAAAGTPNTAWVATAGGAAYFDGKDWKVYTRENGLPEGDLNGVMVQGNKILFSTRGSGLIVFSITQP